jgi:Tfp pilus assembly protein PilF
MPGYAELLHDAVACYQAGRLDDARKLYERILQANPRDPDALNLLGVVLARQGNLGKAIQVLRRAVTVHPRFPDGLSNLSKVLLESGQPEAARATCAQALAYAPADPEILNNYGNALLALGQHQAALASYRAALAVRPGYPEALTNQGQCLLALGDLTQGWQSYEHRWRLPGLTPTQRGFSAPRWTGAQPIAGKRLLLHAEQGLGDTIQFCRYARLAADHGAEIVLQVQKPLVRLMATLPGVSGVIAEGGRQPPFDLHCPLISLPLAFRTDLDSIPAGVPYLRANPERTAGWRQRLAPLPRPHIGLVWAGNPRHGNTEAAAVDLRRSMKLADFNGLGDATFVSLQKGEPAREGRKPPPGLRLVDWTADLDDFADTAALIAALDLVIGVDTSVIHLAGAIGMPVWVLNRYDRCWRWLHGRTDTPWYPSMRLFTQPAPGDWRTVVAEVRAALAAEHPSAATRIAGLGGPVRTG